MEPNNRLDDEMRDILSNGDVSIHDVIDVNTTVRDKYERILSPWLTGDFEDYEKVTRPRYIKNPRIMAEKACEFFIEKEQNNQPLVYTQLAIEGLGFAQRKCLDAYIKYDDADFEDLIRTLKSIIMIWNEIRAYDPVMGRNAQWMLKNNYKNDYGDEIKQVIEDTCEYNINVNDPRKK